MGRPLASLVPPLPGVTPPTIFVPYSRHGLGVERAGRAGDALADHFRRRVDEDSHVFADGMWSRSLFQILRGVSWHYFGTAPRQPASSRCTISATSGL